MIKYDDFAKIELKVAKIIESERVEGSEKLLKLQVELGDEKRQVIAGIGKFYSPEDIIGKSVVIVTNLESRKLMGLESHGMVLAASNDEKLSIIVPDSDIASGANIK